MSDSRFLEMRPLIALTGTSEFKYLLTFYEPDKNPTPSRRQATFAGTTESDCLRQLAGALEQYGSWDAVFQAIKDANVVTNSGS